MGKINTLAIDIGHNVSCDVGAVGIRREDDLNRKVGIALIGKCRNAGIKVVDCTPESAYSLFDSLNQRCVSANNGGAEFFISIHHNACPGGHGAEALCIIGGLSENVSNIILQEICNIGLSNRGVKDSRNLFVINNTLMPAVLLECAFCDSEQDMSGYDTSAVANAIFIGICRAFDIKANSSGNNGSTNVDGGTSPVEEYYTVVALDTLWGISEKFETSVDWLVQVNGIKDKDLIFVGQVIRIR